MALPVTVYRWDDVGAPQIVDGKPSEYMNVLKKCLVEGYGSKASLGWALELEIADPPHFAFSNDVSNGGSGGCVFFDATSDIAGNDIRVSSCLEYISKDIKNKEGGYFYFNRGYSSPSSMSKKWVLIGTSKAYYIFILPESNIGKNYTQTLSFISFFAGDFDSLYNNDPASFVAFTGGLNTTVYNWTYTLPYKLSDGSANSILEVYSLSAGTDKNTASLVSIDGVFFKVDGKITTESDVSALCPVYIGMGTGNLNKWVDQDGEFPYLRGIIPGLYLATSAGYRNNPYPVIKTFDNESYFLLPSTNQHTGCCWISLGSW